MLPFQAARELIRRSELKAVLKSLAERWLKMAAELERAQALRDELRT
jgi:hypothetical protein